MEIENGRMFRNHPTDNYLGCTHCKRLFYYGQDSTVEGILCPYCYTVNFRLISK